MHVYVCALFSVHDSALISYKWAPPKIDIVYGSRSAEGLTRPMIDEIHRTNHYGVLCGARLYFFKQIC